MNVHLIQNQQFTIKFKAPEEGENGNGLELLEETLTFRIPPLSELTNQLEGKENTTEKACMCELLTKLLENRDENEIGNISTIKATIGNSMESSTMEVRLEGKCLTCLLNECQEYLRLDLKMIMRDVVYEPNTTLNFPDLSLSITEEENEVVFIGRRVVSTTALQFKDGATYTGRMDISLLLATSPTYEKIMKYSSLNLKSPAEAVAFDFELVAENGVRYPCHRVFLAGNSSVLARMFQTEWKETQEKVCYMNLSANGVMALLRFVYHANFNQALRSSRIAVELLEIAHQFEILLLFKAMRVLLVKQPGAWFSIDVAQKLLSFTERAEGYRDLKWKAEKVIKS